MDRGLFTGALGMLARSVETEVIANNLANFETVGFKQDTVVFRDFPSMLAHRIHDDKVSTPVMVIDRAPPVGAMSTGVQVDDIATTFDLSPNVRQTGNKLDMVLEGVPGVDRSYAFFEVQTPQERLYTRAGNFTVNSEGFLITQLGALVLGVNGPVKVDPNNVEFEEDGRILYNPTYDGNGLNRWENTAELDRLRIVSFRDKGGLEKSGYTFYRATDQSGPPEQVLFGVNLRTGQLEGSNVNIVREMTDMIKAQRAYEAIARVVQTHDTLLGQANTEVGRV